MSGRVRRAVAVLACLVLVAACGGDDAPAPADESSTTSGQVGTPTTGRSGANPEATPNTAPAPSVTGSAAPPSTGGASAPEPTVPSGSSGAAVVPPVGAVGSYGPWYLRADAAASIVLEVRSQSGAEPSAKTIDAVRSVLAEVSGKTVTTAGGGVPGGARQWTADDIRTEADREGPAQTSDAAVLTLLFVRGQLAGADRTIGVAVRSDVAAVFSDKVDEAADPLSGSDRIEQAVTTHEVGHLLGLVDLVLDTGREDPEHPGHSTNRSSVMYYAVESTLVGDLLGGGPPTRFDDADRADLRAIAGR